jgi:hypothetical protein
MFVYNTYVRSVSARKVRRRFWHKFQDATTAYRETFNRIVNKLKQKGSPLDEKLK